MGATTTPQLVGQAVHEVDTDPGVGVSQYYALAVYDGSPVALYQRASQMVALAVYEGEPNQGVINVGLNNLYALAVYGIGSPEDLRVRAFTFILDGHKFYALQLGELGTWVLDASTQQWHKWGTAGYTRWNAQLGLAWDGRVLVADTVNNIVWELSPDVQNDEGFKDIVHVSSAIILNTSHDYISLDEVTLSLSSGFVESLNPKITLEFSDDRGVTYETPEDGTISLTVGDYGEEVKWLSLGAFPSPGRILRITDVGGPVRIDWATARVNGEE